MAKHQHMWEEVAEDLAEWIDDISTEVAEALMDNGRSPFGAQVTERQKVLYYEQQVYLPDGQPNVQGRQALLSRLGVSGYTQVMQAVNEYRQRGEMLADAEVTGG